MRILFLGYNTDQTTLIDALKQKGCEVDHETGPLVEPPSADLGISYGYRHILKRRALEGCPILNLHIAYLPFNRGAHPNYWAFADGTKHGVTIHLVDEGVDTGPILYQREIKFPPEDNTYAKTYARLGLEMENLFIEHMDDILSGNYTPKAQNGEGSLHRVRDLPEDFAGWDEPISP